MAGRRITAKEVDRAVKLSGFTLKPHSTLNAEQRCGCPIGIIAMVSGHLGPISRWFSTGTLMKLVGVTAEYGWGFVYGFDGNIFSTGTPEGDLGWQDGWAVRNAFGITES